MFSKRKKLIICGCSYTANYARQEKIEEFPIWGELLAEKLDMGLINLGRCGYGNGAIYHTLIEEILNRKDIGLVVVMWSEVQRVCFFTDKKPVPLKNGGVHIPDPWDCFHPERVVLDADWHDKFFIPPTKNTKKSGLKYDISVALRNKFLDDIRGGVKESLGYMYALQTICESNNLPYLQIQGCRAVMGKILETNIQNSKQLAKYIIDSPYLNKINVNFIGWPIVESIGGYCFDSLLTKYNYRISDEDSHPNGEGHKLIAGVIYNEYEKIYP